MQFLFLITKSQISCEISHQPSNVIKFMVFSSTSKTRDVLLTTIFFSWIRSRTPQQSCCSWLLSSVTQTPSDAGHLMFWCNLSQKTRDKEDCSTWKSTVIRCWCVCLSGKYKAKLVCRLGRAFTLHRYCWGLSVALWQGCALESTPDAPQGSVSHDSFEHRTHTLTHRGCRCSFLWCDVKRKCKMDKLPTITFPSSAVIVISVSPLKRIIWSFLSLLLCVLDEYDYCFTPVFKPLCLIPHSV